MDVDEDRILDDAEAGLGVDPTKTYTFSEDLEDAEAVADMAMVDYKDIIDYDLDYSKGGQLWKQRNGIE